MRRQQLIGGPIADAWNNGGVLDTDGRVTIEFGYLLRESEPGTLGPYTRGPVRWFQRYDNISKETILPNIKVIDIDRRLDQDAQTCKIVMANTQMTSDHQPQYSADPNAPGLPGLFTFSRGESPDETALWPNHKASIWHRQIVPNALLRTYQGVGGKDLSIPAACAAGNLVRTGTWLVDDVTLGSDGLITINCRDMAKLLVEQFLYPNLVPASCYPLQYCRPDLGILDLTGVQLYFDFSEIVKDVALWSGFWHFDRFDPNGGPQMFGVLETTGAWDTQGILDPSMFDKQRAMDVIKQIGDIVSYITYVDESGGLHFHSPNHFQGGNRLHETGERVQYLPLISELQNLVDYTISMSDKSARTEIIVASDDPIENVPDTLAASYKPPAMNGYHIPDGTLAGDTIFHVDPGAAYGDFLRGMVKPTIIPIPAGHGVTQDEAFRMAELLALYTTFALRQAKVTCAANSLIQLDDQVRIRERTTAEVYCVDDLTEVLTQRGWLNFKDVEIGDLALSLNPETDTTEWVPIVSVFRSYRTHERMMHLEGKRHSSLTTLNHRWWVNRARDKARFAWEWQTTEQLNTTSRIPRSGVPGACPEIPRYADEFVELLAWYMTEGTDQTKERIASIAQSNKVNPENCRSIERVLETLYGQRGTNALRGRWNRYIRPDGKANYRINQLDSVLLKELAPNKVPRPEVLVQFTLAQLHLFMAICIQGDGHLQWCLDQYGDETGATIDRFSQDIGPALDAFQMVCALAGVPFGCKKSNPNPADDNYTVTLSKERFTWPKRNQTHTKTAEVVEYTGWVWCPELERHHIWFARRGGSVYFTGNTHYVRGISTHHDIESGEHTMTLDTYWIGDQTNWVLGSSESQIDLFMKLYATYVGGRPLDPGTLDSFIGTADTL